jgi:predicted DNA-binding transcriptional regulator AlpA
MDRILRPNQVADLVGLGDRRLRQLEREGKFPRRFKIHPNSNASGYLESEVEAWIKASAAAREAEPAAAQP